MSEWKSPRKIEEEIRDYRRNKFEVLMQEVDRGKISLEIAIQALREVEEEEDGR